MIGNTHLRFTVRHAARVCAMLLLLIAGEASADTIYKCVSASGAIAYQEAPCGAHATRTSVRIHEQPLIDAHDSEVTAPVPRSTRESGALPHGHARSFHGKSAAQATSWECRATDGEVFYRHTRCPHSVPGDGVMRSGSTYAIGPGKGGRAHARNAWSPVVVHARKVSRGEACRQINAIAAVDRDGSERDEHVSVYEHDLGRDPCAGY